MEKTNLLGKFSNGVSHFPDPVAPPSGATAIRTLDDTEMASAAGGDNVVIWVSPPTGP